MDEDEDEALRIGFSGVVTCFAAACAACVMAEVAACMRKKPCLMLYIVFQIAIMNGESFVHFACDGGVMQCGVVCVRVSCVRCLSSRVATLIS